MLTDLSLQKYDGHYTTFLPTNCNCAVKHCAVGGAKNPSLYCQSSDRFLRTTILSQQQQPQRQHMNKTVHDKAW